jgi:hypothetical protein
MLWYRLHCMFLRHPHGLHASTRNSNPGQVELDEVQETNNTANARRLTLIYWTKIQKIQQCDSRNILKLAEHSSMIRNELKDLMTSDDYLVTKSCPALFQVFLVECGKATYSRSLPTTGYLAVKCLYQPANAVRCSSVNCLRVKSSVFAFGPVEIDQHTQNLKIWQCSHQKPVCKII